MWMAASISAAQVDDQDHSVSPNMIDLLKDTNVISIQVVQMRRYRDERLVQPVYTGGGPLV